VTINASDDAYVFAGTPSSNFGSADRLDVRPDVNSSGRKDTFLKFDLTQLSGKEIQTAKLRLFGRLENSSKSDAAQVSLYAASGGKWSQSSINWINRPATDAAPIAAATILGGGGRWYEWDLSAFLKKQQSLGRASVTLVLRNVSGRGAVANFSSSESGSNPPELNASVAS
jgi:hypothetical protein